MTDQKTKTKIRTLKLKRASLNPLLIKPEYIKLGDPDKTEMKDKKDPKKTISFFRVPIYLSLPKGFVIYDSPDPELKDVLKEDTNYAFIVDIGTCSSFGISEKKDEETNKLKGYSLQFSLIPYRGRDERSEKVLENMKAWADRIKDLLLEAKESVDEPYLIREQLADHTGFTFVRYPKDEKKKFKPDGKPSLYAKLKFLGVRESRDDEGKPLKKHSAMYTNFYEIPVKQPVPQEGNPDFEDVDFTPVIEYDPEIFAEEEEAKLKEEEELAKLKDTDKDKYELKMKEKNKKESLIAKERQKLVDVMKTRNQVFSQTKFSEIIGKRCYVRAVVNIAEVFVGATIKNIQVKLEDCDWCMQDSFGGPRSLIRRNRKVIVSESQDDGINPLLKDDKTEKKEDDDTISEDGFAIDGVTDK